MAAATASTHLFCIIVIIFSGGKGKEGVGEGGGARNGECCYLYLLTYYLYKNGKMFLQAEPMVLWKLN